MNGCPYCVEFSPLWDKLTKKYQDKINMIKIERSENPAMIEKYGIQSFPTIILEKTSQIKFEDERSEKNFEKFLKQNNII